MRMRERSWRHALVIVGLIAGVMATAAVTVAPDAAVQEFACGTKQTS